VGVRVRGAVGRLGRSRGGVGEEWRWEDEWSSASGERAARRQRGRGEKRKEKVGVRAWGCHVARGYRGAWPRPADGARQRLERGTRGRHAPRAHCPAETERGEASDGWAAAQCRATVPLTSGAGLSAGVGRAQARVRSCADVRGSAREETDTATRMHSKVLHLFELV
jgi:hypothetical protein